MARFLQEFPAIPCRCVLWSHVNGCSYPYLPAGFVQCFARTMFTTRYSCSNALWQEDERKDILSRSDVVYGMGNFLPSEIKPKAEYVHDASFIIGYVGTVDYAKINRNFLDYYEAIINNFSNVKICMLGHVSEEIRKDIAERNLQPYFELPGYVDDIESYMHKFDVFVYLLSPDNYATTENALLEAMAYGLPVIVLDNSVESCIVQNNVSGYIVHDIEEMLDKLHYLYEAKHARALGKSAREFVIREYDVEENMNRYYGVCEGAMSDEKKVYDYTKLLGHDGYDAFLYFAQEAGQRIIMATEKGNRNLLENIDPIFYGKNKSSVYQYLRYYPEDKRLKTITEYLRHFLH